MPKTKEKLITMQFLERYSGELAQVQKIFVAFVREEDIRLGRNTPIPQGSESFFATVDKQYVPLVAELVSADLQQPKKTRSKQKCFFMFRPRNQRSDLFMQQTE